MRSARHDMFPANVPTMGLTSKVSKASCLTLTVSILMFFTCMGYGGVFMPEMVPFILLAPSSILLFVFWISYDITNIIIRWYRKKFSDQSFDYDYDGNTHYV